MQIITPLVRRFSKDEEAATMIEYALMLGLIAIVCFVAVQVVGTNANTLFNSMANQIPA